jgi:hypothetical protein
MIYFDYKFVQKLTHEKIVHYFYSTTLFSLFIKRADDYLASSKRIRFINFESRHLPLL